MTPLETLQQIREILDGTPASQQPFAKHLILTMVDDTLKRSERLSQCKVRDATETESD